MSRCNLHFLASATWLVLAANELYVSYVAK